MATARVLVVEDYPSVFAVMCHLLSAEGEYEVLSKIGMIR